MKLLNKACNHSILCKDEEEALGKLIRIGAELEESSQGEELDEKNQNLVDEGLEARKTLVAHNVKLAIKWAQEFVPQNEIASDEIKQDALLGLLEAAKRFDPTKGRFSTFSETYVLGEMIKGAASRGQLIRLPKSFKLKAALIDSEIETFRMIHGRSPSLNELAKKTEFSKEDVEKLQTISAQMQSVCTQQYPGFENKKALEDSLTHSFVQQAFEVKETLIDTERMSDWLLKKVGEKAVTEELRAITSRALANLSGLQINVASPALTRQLRFVLSEENVIDVSKSVKVNPLDISIPPTLGRRKLWLMLLGPKLTKL